MVVASFSQGGFQLRITQNYFGCCWEIWIGVGGLGAWGIGSGGGEQNFGLETNECEN